MQIERSSAAQAPVSEFVKTKVLVSQRNRACDPLTASSSPPENIGTPSVQELFFQFMGWLGVKLGDCPVGMVYAMG